MWWLSYGDGERSWHCQVVAMKVLAPDDGHGGTGTDDGGAQALALGWR